MSLVFDGNSSGNVLIFAETPTMWEFLFLLRNTRLLVLRFVKKSTFVPGLFGWQSSFSWVFNYGRNTQHRPGWRWGG